MKHHLKEPRILDFLFGLTEPRDNTRIEKHLAECEDCRRRAELLRQRFSTLEALRETEPASERLIADTLRRVRTDRPAREVRFPTFAWFTGAAAVAALLLAVFVVAPRWGREPAVELAKHEAPPAPTVAPAETIAPEPEPTTPPSPTEIPSGTLLADSGPMIVTDAEDREERLRAAEEVFSAAADRPPAGPVLAAAHPFAAGTPPAARAAAPSREKREAKRVRPPRATKAEPWAARLPKGWSYEPTNQVRVMLIPLKSKADDLIAPPAAGFRARHWQIRVLNDSTNDQVVSVTRTFERPGETLQLRDAEGRLVLITEQRAVIEADVPAGGFRALRCLLLEPPDEPSRP